MRIHIHNKVLAGLVLMSIAILVAAANAGWTHDDGIYFKPDGDADDYIQIETTANVPTIKTIGANNLNIEPSANLKITVASGDMIVADDTGQIDIELRSGSVGSNPVIKFKETTTLKWEILNANADDTFQIANQTGSPNGIIMRFFQNGSIQPGTDNTQSFGTPAKRWADIQSVLIRGSDICFENNICMTETVNDLGQIDIGFVVGLPTREQAVTIGLWQYETYQEYVAAHTEDNVFDNSMGETEFNLRRSSVDNDGKPDFTFGRTVRMSLRDVKQALDDIEEIQESLCNQGLNKYC